MKFPVRPLRITCGVLLVLLAVGAYAFSAETGRIVSLAAQRFGCQTGELSPIVLGESQSGSANSPGFRDFLFIVAKVDGQGQANLKLRLVVKEKSKTLLDKTVEVDTFAGEYSIPFLPEQPSGCDTVKLTATLLKAGKVVGQMANEVPFSCGE